MTKDDLLTKLREVESSLHSAEVQALFAAQDQQVKDQFVALRLEVSQKVAQLGNAQLERIAQELETLSGDLQSGIDNLQGQLDRLDQAIAIINTVSSVLGLVGRVLAFA
jgi:biopolymer transport protein ExbB/TolQ